LTDTVLDFAMEYSRLGLAVLPLHYPVRHQHGMVCSCGRANCNSPAKHPVGQLVPNGLKNATTDHDVAMVSRVASSASTSIRDTVAMIQLPPWKSNTGHYLRHGDS
jgi:hypothetical protein